jgi:enoyl-CoA hydratase
MPKLLYEKRDYIARLTLNRPEVRNALDSELICLLADAFEEVRCDDGVRVAIVTGAGDAFCAGADLRLLIPLANKEREPENDFERRILNEPRPSERAILRNYDVEKPVIAAVNGAAIAGGMELVLGTDLRVASETARFGQQEVRWALFPAGGATVRLPTQTYFARAMELLLTGDLIDARTALDWGLLNRVVPQAEVLDAAYDLAGRIARNGPVAVKAIRKSVRACLGRPEAEALKMEMYDFAPPVFASEDAREGRLSFVEKRAANFKGR